MVKNRIIPFVLLTLLSSIQDLRQHNTETPSKTPPSFPVQTELALSRNAPIHTQQCDIL